MSSKQPTIKQKKAVDMLLENVKDKKPKPTSAILTQAGYGKIALQPGRVTGATGFQKALLDAGVTDDKLTKVIDEGLAAKKLWGKNAIEYPDYSVRHKFLETSLRIKGLIKDDTTGNIYNTYVQQNNVNPNAPEAKELVSDMVAMLMAKTKEE